MRCLSAENEVYDRARRRRTALLVGRVLLGGVQRGLDHSSDGHGCVLHSGHEEAGQGAGGQVPEEEQGQPRWQRHSRTQSGGHHGQ